MVTIHGQGPWHATVWDLGVVRCQPASGQLHEAIGQTPQNIGGTEWELSFSVECTLAIHLSERRVQAGMPDDGAGKTTVPRFGVFQYGKAHRVSRRRGRTPRVGVTLWCRADAKAG